jgi:hypothetical protein
MKILSITAVLFCISNLAFSQAADFIVVKKGKQNYATFMKGAPARFYTSGEYIESRVMDIRDDSLFFKQIIIRQVPTAWGVYQLDTVATPVRSIHFKDITAIPRKHQAFSYIRNGSIFMIGGAGYILLNVVNGAYLHDPPFGSRNLPSMLAATGVLATGFIMNRLHKPVLQFGKKYTIHYVNLTTTK